MGTVVTTLEAAAEFLSMDWAGRAVLGFLSLLFIGPVLGWFRRALGPARIDRATVLNGGTVIATFELRSAVFGALADSWPANGARAATLLLFAKEPTPGKVKTRLAEEVGAEKATELACSFLDDALSLCTDVARENVRATVLASPPESRPSFEARAAGRIHVGTQCDGDLGERLAVGLEAALRGGAPKAVAIGSDIPDLPIERIREAFAALDSKDCVLGPAGDGGYYLVGVRSVEGARALRAKIAWSTDRALQDTENAFRAKNLTVALLARHDDVDDGPSLRALERRLREGKTRAPATAKALGLST